jgi:DNA adenine methylase
VKLRRPVLRYHGGKWRLAPWVVANLPPHRIYVEPYGGAASVLMRKSRSYAEVYNDLDDEVVNVFRCLRHPGLASRLMLLLDLTPFARTEFLEAYPEKPPRDPVERARLTIVKAFMGFGSAAIHDVFPRGMRTRASLWTPPTGFRSNAWRSGTTPAHDWGNFPPQVEAFCKRLQGVVIEHRDALEVIQQHDRPDTVFYVDPPYMGALRNANRTQGRVYSHDMTSEEDHRALAEVLNNVQGRVVLSGYHSDIYDELYGGWTVLEKAALADGARKRTEVLWISPGPTCGQEGLFA